MKIKPIRHDDLYEDLSNPTKRYYFALETVDMCDDLWELCIPWKFFAWNRLHKDIHRRNEHCKWYNENV